MRARTSKRRRYGLAPEVLESRALLSADISLYDLGTPTLQDVWVDPVHGNDNNSGVNRGQALQSIAEAWLRIPPFQSLDTVNGTGYRIQLVAGSYAHNLVEASGWMSDRHGTYKCPVIINAADGAGTVNIHATFNMQNDSYLYLIGLNLVTDPGGAGGGNVVQLASDDHVLIRSCGLHGFDGTIREPQETLKANQSQYVYVESSDIGGAFWFGLDFVAVQYGHIIGSRIHNTGDDGLVLKGGSADITVADCTIEDIGNVGFAAGQGAGFEFMVAPWLHYEAYDLKFVDNVVQNVQNAGMAVRGGYNILLADNTLYRVGLNQGSGSSQLLFSPGGRSCDGDAATCQAHLAAGGWGPTTPGASGEWIPNKNVYVYNNVIDNPAGVATLSQILTIFTPVTAPSGTNIPNPVLSDDNLQIKGNVIWDGATTHDLGANDPASDARLRADNAIGRFEPQFVDAVHGNFRPLPGGNLTTYASASTANFLGGDLPGRPVEPQGDLSNLVDLDRSGLLRPLAGTPGVYNDPVTSPAAPVSVFDLLSHTHNGLPYPMLLAPPITSSTPAAFAVSKPTARQVATSAAPVSSPIVILHATKRETSHPAHKSVPAARVFPTPLSRHFHHFARVKGVRAP